MSGYTTLAATENGTAKASTPVPSVAPPSHETFAAAKNEATTTTPLDATAVDQKLMTEEGRRVEMDNGKWTRGGPQGGAVGEGGNGDVNGGEKSTTAEDVKREEGEVEVEGEMKE